MRTLGSMVSILAMLLSAAPAASPQANPASDERTSLIVVLSDGRRQTFSATDARIEFKGTAMIVSQGGHQQSIPTSDIARIEFANNASTFGRGRFLGKWRVGEGNGSHFTITLDRSGEASKSIGAAHGTWTVVNGEARIAWDDGWHDAIRKVGNKFEKVAFEPGKSFSDPPANVTEAENTGREPI